MDTNASSTPRTRTPEQTAAAITRATAKVHEQARTGNVPTLLRQFITEHDTRQVWTVGSRTTGGTIYTIDLCADASGIQTMCDCEAVGICWHRQAVRLAMFGELDYHTPGQPAAAAPDPWDDEAFAAIV